MRRLTNIQFVPLNPRPMLQSLVNEEVIVRLKWNQTEYTGRLVSVDSYMNIQMSNTEEWSNGKSAGMLGQVLIRYDLERYFCCVAMAANQEKV